MARVLQLRRGTNAENNLFTGAAGELTVDTTNEVLRIHDGATQGGTTVGLDAGFMAPFAGTTAPDGWLICDGSAVSRTDYARLFAAIGTTYGEGDGNSTFNLPNESPTHKIIEFQEPTAANNYTWYRLYDDGWVEQGGTASNRQGSVVLPITMADANYMISQTLILSGTVPSSAQICPYVQNVSATGFNYYNNLTGTVVWQVSGMAASGSTQQNIVCIKY